MGVEWSSAFCHVVPDFFQPQINADERKLGSFLLLFICVYRRPSAVPKFNSIFLLHPGDSFRANFSDAVLLPVLREQLQVINPWMEADQVEDAIKKLTASFPGTQLLKNNQYALHLLTEGTSVGEKPADGRAEPDGALCGFQGAVA